jgi:hypothetical protein
MNIDRKLQDIFMTAISFVVQALDFHTLILFLMEGKVTQQISRIKIGPQQTGI